MNHNIIVTYKHVRIRPLVEADLENLRIWRNDKKLSAYLRKIDPITPEQQKIWWKRDCQDETTATFAIEEICELHRMVGSVSIYDINGDTAEIGRIMVGDPEASGKKIGYFAKLMAMYAGYECFGIETFFNEVHEENMPALVNDKKSGFIITGKHAFPGGGYELEMNMPKAHFKETHDFLEEFKLEK